MTCLQIPLIQIILSPIFYPKVATDNEEKADISEEILRIFTVVFAVVNGLTLVGFEILIKKLFIVRIPIEKVP
jgi:hypothetical protein